MGFCFCYEDDCHSIFICLMFMKKIILVCYLLSLSSLFLGQEKTTPFKAGEWLEYKMSYSGFLKAGTAKLQLEEVDLNDKKVFHATGLGETSTVIGWFFKVRDIYDCLVYTSAAAYALLCSTLPFRRSIPSIYSSSSSPSSFPHFSLWTRQGTPSSPSA